MLLLATLFTVTLFRFDREEPRASLFAPVLIVGGFGPLLLAWLQPVPLVPSDPGEVLPGWWWARVSCGDSEQVVRWGVVCGLWRHDYPTTGAGRTPNYWPVRLAAWSWATRRSWLL